jgi:sugar fermentation stimulation protein A
MTDLWQAATLLRRYKRFLADVELPNGEQLTVHCPNTGAMTGCMEVGARIWLSRSDNPKRKYPMTWEVIELSSGAAICIHSAHANRVVERALLAGLIPELSNYQQCRREVKLGEGSRVDFVLSDPGRCVMEVKSVTLALKGGLGAFPDSLSTRASRHLRELIEVAGQGDRAVLLLLAMHTGIDRIAPADAIDRTYGETLRSAIAAGVEVLCYGCDVSRSGVQLRRALPFLERLPPELL